MDYYFITGTSKGLGKALTELLLENENNFVYGLSRNASIQHKNYHHTSIDLSNIEQLENYQFPSLSGAKKLTLINNAGIVGEVNYLGNVSDKNIINCYNLNLIAPAVLSNKFMRHFSDSEKLIINISSGAGRTPIDGWNIYCSTKAGMDMLSQVVAEEAKIKNSNTSILSLAPGIIDTAMQTEIRSSNQEGFSNIERFIEYKKNGDLVQPEDTAKQIYQFIKNKELQQNVICSVRDLTN